MTEQFTDEELQDKAHDLGLLNILIANMELLEIDFSLIPGDKPKAMMNGHEVEAETIPALSYACFQTLRDIYENT